MPAELREALDQAVSAAEAAPSEPAPTLSVVPSDPAPTADAPTSDHTDGQRNDPAPVAATAEATLDAPPSSDASTAPESVPAEPASARSRADRPPASWKGAAKEDWDKLPSTAKQEIHRRERMADTAIASSEGARKFQQQFVQSIQPYMARIQANGYDNPVEAAHQMFKMDYLLATAPMPQRAQAMAQLIKDYGVDLTALDNALVGGGAVVDPLESKLNQLLEQRLAPVQQLMRQQQEHQRAIEMAETNEVRSTVTQMEQDTTTYPYFDDVREDMADLIEIQSKRGVYLSPSEAYTRAVAMNPALSSRVQAQAVQQQTRQLAASANAQAQRALNASVSVGGAPASGGSGARQFGSGADLRGTITAALEGNSGRI